MFDVLPAPKARATRGRPVSRYADKTGNSTIGIGLAILRIVGRADGSLTLTEIARRAHMSLGRATRYITSLTRSDYLFQSEETGRIALGPAAFELGMFAMPSVDSSLVTRYFTQRLSRLTGLTSAVCVWDAQGPTVSSVALGAQAHLSGLKAGGPVSLLDHALGQIFIAYEKNDTVEDVLKVQLRKRNRFLGKPQRLMMRDVEALRLAISRAGEAQTWIDDARSLAEIAVPVFDNDGRLAMSIGLIGLTQSRDSVAGKIAARRLNCIAERLWICLDTLSMAHK